MRVFSVYLCRVTLLRCRVLRLLVFRVFLRQVMFKTRGIVKLLLLLEVAVWLPWKLNISSPVTTEYFRDLINTFNKRKVISLRLAPVVFILARLIGVWLEFEGKAGDDCLLRSGNDALI